MNEGTPGPAESAAQEPPPPPHPRDLAIDVAGKEAFTWLNEWRRRHSLTTAEYLNILNVVQGAHLRQMGLLEREAMLRGVVPEVNHASGG